MDYEIVVTYADGHKTHVGCATYTDVENNMISLCRRGLDNIPVKNIEIIHNF